MTNNLPALEVNFNKELDTQFINFIEYLDEWSQLSQTKGSDTMVFYFRDIEDRTLFTKKLNKHFFNLSIKEIESYPQSLAYNKNYYSDIEL